jgi:hypothetical protein
MGPVANRAPVRRPAVAEAEGALTTATIIELYRRLLKDAAERTGGEASAVDWQLHDSIIERAPKQEAAGLAEPVWAPRPQSSSRRRGGEGRTPPTSRASW